MLHLFLFWFCWHLFFLSIVLFFVVFAFVSSLHYFSHLSNFIFLILLSNFSYYLFQSVQIYLSVWVCPYLWPWQLIYLNLFLSNSFALIYCVSFFPSRILILHYFSIVFISLSISFSFSVYFPICYQERYCECFFL